MHKKHVIINIGRQYGSGGREIGEKLAHRLGLGYYDKQLVYLAAEKTGLDPDLFKRQNEEVKSGIGYVLAHLTQIAAESMPLSDRLFIATSQTIQSIAQHESCVIVGRCASYVLQDLHKDHVIIDCFVRNSDEEQRISRVMERNNLSREEALKKIQTTSKGRKQYYERYTDKRWCALEDYDLTLNTARCSIDDAVELIATYVEQVLADQGLSLDEVR